jgi:lysophospholipase L1-like esterase
MASAAPSRSERVATLIAIAIFLYFIWFGTQVNATAHLLDTSRYVLNSGLLVVAALTLTVFAFQRARRKARLGGPILMLATILLIVGATDATILAFRFDTAGPNWGLCLTHKRWVDTFVRTNEAGFWERSLEPYKRLRPDDRYIVAAVGDSFTFGQGILGSEKRFTNRLQGALQQMYGPRVEVLNFGLGSGDTRVEKKWVDESVSQVHPDVVMLFYLSNDIQAADIYRPANTVKDPQSLLIASPTFNYTYWYLLGPFAYQASGSAYFHNLLIAYMDKEKMQAHLQEIAALIESVKKTGARPVFVILPFPHMWVDVKPEVQEQIYARISEQATTSGASVLNLAPLENALPPAKFQINQIDGHPNADAHALIAQNVFEWMTAQRDLAPGLSNNR